MSRLRILFEYNKRRGEVTELLVDDGDRTAPDSYHDAIARQIADEIVPQALIRDAGEQVIADPVSVPEPARERRRQKRGEGDP